SPGKCSVGPSEARSPCASPWRDSPPRSGVPQADNVMALAGLLGGNGFQRLGALNTPGTDLHGVARLVPLRRVASKGNYGAMPTQRLSDLLFTGSIRFPLK